MLSLLLTTVNFLLPVANHATYAFQDIYIGEEEDIIKSMRPAGKAFEQGFQA